MTQACFVIPAFMRIGSVQWVWDSLLKPGTMLPDVNGVWHIGRGTDLKELEERLNKLAKENHV